MNQKPKLLLFASGVRGVPSCEGCAVSHRGPDCSYRGKTYCTANTPQPYPTSRTPNVVAHKLDARVREGFICLYL